MNALTAALEDPATGPARLRALLDAELERGTRELAAKRSGYEDPVRVAFDAAGRAALPVDAGFRADPALADDRAWRVVAAALHALQTAAELPPPESAADLHARAGDQAGHLVLALAPADPELVLLAFDEALAGADRLRAQGLVVPEGIIAADDLREPAGPRHPLRVAEVIARLGGDPEDPTDADDDAMLRILGDRTRAARPHEDPDPMRRIARRILQRLDGMGKWGGYHTDFSHLARGFAGHERSAADAVGEALLEAGLLAEKPSVGQRHVFLNPRRAGEIHRLIDEGTVPADLRLPGT